MTVPATRTYKGDDETPEHIADLARVLFGVNWREHGVTYTRLDDGGFKLINAKQPQFPVKVRIGSAASYRSEEPS